MYLSLESMFCFFWLFFFLFYTQCMYYLCFLGVHWLKRLCYMKGYIILCMIHYLLINHGNIKQTTLALSCFVLQNEGAGELVFVATHSGYGHKYKVQFVFCFFFLFFFFNDANMSMVVRIKKREYFIGRFLCLLKQMQQNKDELSVALSFCFNQPVGGRM